MTDLIKEIEESIVLMSLCSVRSDVYGGGERHVTRYCGGPDVERKLRREIRHQGES